MSNMMCAACILGISIGIGGSIFLYRVLRRWWAVRPSEHPLLGENESVAGSSKNTESMLKANCSPEAVAAHGASDCSTAAASDVTCKECDDGPNSAVTVENIFNSGSGKPRRRPHSSAMHRSESALVSRERSVAPARGPKLIPLSADTIRSEPAGDSLSTVLHEQRQHSVKEIVDGCVQKDQATELHDAKLFPGAKIISPGNSSFHHSTPEDRDSVTASRMMNGSESESMYVSMDRECPDEDVVDVLADVRYTLSWHDSVYVDPSPSRSCISLDDSVFLRDLNIECSQEAEVLAACNAVSNLEQLEPEVAGVLSDCGDVERCFGRLRRRSSVRAVLSHYSLGVADSVLAGDCTASWHDSVDSAAVDEASLSSSAGVGLHSGFLWDDEGLDTDARSCEFVPACRRATRSLSPAVQHRQLDFRASLGPCSTGRVNGNVVNWTDVDCNTSADLTPCSVYDVNQRLSGRLHAQHVSH